MDQNRGIHSEDLTTTRANGLKRLSHPAGQLPSVDRLLRSNAGQTLVAAFGRAPVASVLAKQISLARKEILESGKPAVSEQHLLAASENELKQSSVALKTILNLTGTVLHTNLGRARLPDTAIQAIAQVASEPSNLEFDLATGSRGDRDAQLESLLKALTGAEAATVVNNNAAAVMLVLNTFALGKSVPVSRGELVEIGGSFRIPEIMMRSGCQLVEVGATNRTRISDFENAIDETTAMLMKVHTSNYDVQGFTESTSESALADLANQHNLPFMIDLGSGTLVNLTQYGLPREPTVQEALAQGATIVTFSGDKLLGGPQAGIIVGSRQFIKAIKQNPMKRALRVDKMTVAGLVEVLRLYQTPETLVQTLPTIRDLARPENEIKKLGETVLHALSTAETGEFDLTLVSVKSQIGSGALPIERIPSWAIAITAARSTSPNRTLMNLSERLRACSNAIVGRIHDDQLLLDLRTLYNPDPLIAGLRHTLAS